MNNRCPGNIWPRFRNSASDGVRANRDVRGLTRLQKTQPSIHRHTQDGRPPGRFLVIQDAPRIKASRAGCRDDDAAVAASPNHNQPQSCFPMNSGMVAWLSAEMSERLSTF
jgi:hypothetical protein